MKKLLIFIVLFIFAIPLFSIEVGGHITEDTVWSPENNPYLVIGNIYVDEGVTLIILPGTIIKLYSADFTDPNNHDFWFHSGDTVAKMFWVDGRIIAEGTEQDSIVFTHLQDSTYYHWGTIYISEQAGLCSFKHCCFEYSAYILINLMLQPEGAIALYNGKAIIENNEFLNNFIGVSCRMPSQKITIVNNHFQHPDDSFRDDSIYLNCGVLEGSKPVLIARNYFDGLKAIDSSIPIHFVDNIIIDTGRGCYICMDELACFYNNQFIDCEEGMHSTSSSSDDTLYIKKNRFINGDRGVDIDYAYEEISDNLFEDCALYTGLECHGKVYNNFANGGRIRTPGYLIVYNNISANSNSKGIGATYRNVRFFNCSSINNEYAFGGVFYGYYDNCIFVGNENITQYGVSGNPQFRHCILDFELPPECIDAGGNIWVDSLSVDSLFVDWQNGDFHLVDVSLAIDTGFDTIGYYCPFDLDYNIRVWDGDGDGNAIIDIGPYEFASPELGGIYGTVYQTENGEPLDYVLLKINNEPGEFEFSDSSGHFEFSLTAGVYDIYVERVFYYDVVVEDIEVIDGEFTQINFSMEPTVGVDEINPLQEPTVFMNNYPNPFNPETTIRFSIPSMFKVELSIYNLKGQKVCTLVDNSLAKGLYSTVWDGKDRIGNPVSSGIYLYKLKVGNKKAVKKMLLLR